MLTTRIESIKKINFMLGGFLIAAVPILKIVSIAQYIVLQKVASFDLRVSVITAYEENHPATVN